MEQSDHPDLDSGLAQRQLPHVLVPYAKPELRHVLTRVAYVLSWLAAVGVALWMLWHAWVAFNKPDRRIGNSGHAEIDFAQQWLMARMYVSGLGHEVYNRDVLRTVLQENYPVEDQEPKADRSDVENLMYWMMGSDKDQEAARHVGGPLYPPTHGLLHWPLGLLTPQQGYRVAQTVGVLLGFVAALGISILSRGRIWWPVAAVFFMIYPGFWSSVNLGQNATLTLAIFVWGWVFVHRGRDALGGAVWGLLAFKPVWAAAFLLVLLLSGRRRACLAMVGTGTALGAITLPLVGLHSWFDWLANGREAVRIYNVDENWIKCSRDLLSVPRRWMIDFSNSDYFGRDWWGPTLFGWGLLLSVTALTISLAILRRRQARITTGAPATFLLLGGWFSCFHFMFYDVLLSALPVLLLFTEPRRYLPARLRAFLHLPLREEAPAGSWIYEAVTLALVATMLLLFGLSATFQLTPDQFPQSDTFSLLALWLWCGWMWLRRWPVAQVTPHLEGGG